MGISLSTMLFKMSLPSSVSFDAMFSKHYGLLPDTLAWLVSSKVIGEGSMCLKHKKLELEE